MFPWQPCTAAGATIHIVMRITPVYSFVMMDMWAMAKEKLQENAKKAATLDENMDERKSKSTDSKRLFNQLRVGIQVAIVMKSVFR